MQTLYAALTGGPKAGQERPGEPIEGIMVH